jgi:single-stranded DNA-binding protein
VGWTLGDGEAPATWVRVALLGDAVGALTPRLTKGAQVYCEGRLTLGTWTGRDGEARTGLNLAGEESRTQRGEPLTWLTTESSLEEPSGSDRPIGRG